MSFSKDGRKLGVAVNSLKVGEQIYITKLQPEGAVAATGRVVVGMAVMMINGVDCSIFSKADVVSLLKKDNEIEMILKEDKDNYKIMVKTKKAEKKAEAATASDGSRGGDFSL